MSLIYAVIARGTENTLVDFETAPSNFPKIAKTLLGKIKKNTQQTYLYNQNYHFHYINDDDFTYLCLTDRIFPKRSAFAFLEEIKQIFCEKFSNEQRQNAINYGMSSQFTEILKAKMVRILQIQQCSKIYYNNDPENEKIQRLQNNLTDVKDKMVENIDKILDREEQIQILVHKTHTMNQYASSYKNTAVAVRRDQEWRQMKVKLFIGGMIVALLVVVALFIW